MIAQDHIATLQGATVFDRDGDKIGSLGQIYLDTATNQPSWASVNTGLFGLKESLVPITDADETADGIRVPFDKKTVKDAPNVDVGHDEPLMPDDVSRLYEHYSTERDQAGTARLRKYVVTEDRGDVSVTGEVREEQIDTDIPGRDDNRPR